MARIYTTIHIRKSIERIFDYVTTPDNWQNWHHSSLGVSGATDHSLELGEQVTEEFQVAGRPRRVVWTVREREAPRRWVIEGQMENGSGLTTTYTLVPHGDGTTFEREMVYTMRNPLVAMLGLVFRRRAEAESAEALHRLKRTLESS
ncbi:SRPBCC family protein [Candidatus Poribacteria bacterium]|nr:SRPBCC family protein [Candidatus Poribacteria bacterium]